MLRGAVFAMWLILSTAVAPVGLARQSGACDDLSAQIDSTRSDLDELKTGTMPLLAQAQQLSAVAPGEAAQAAVAGVSPLLTPEAAATYGAIAALIGSRIGIWQDANRDAPAPAFWGDLVTNAFDWDTTFAATAPVQPFVSSLAALNSVLSDLQQLGSKAQADMALITALDQAHTECEADQQPRPMPTPPPASSGGDDGAANGQAVCSVGGAAGYSNTDCFTLEMDAALAVWTACTEAYFAAERDAFRTGGDPPANTCDGPWHAQIDAISARWGHP